MWEEQDFVVAGLGRRALRGRGPRAGRGRRRPGAQDQHRALAAPTWRARPRPAAHRLSTSDVLAPDVDGVVISPGPGDPGLLDRPGGPGPGRHRRRATAAGHLPGPPDRGARGGRARRSACASATTPPTTRCATRSPAASRSPPRTTRSRSSATSLPEGSGFYRQPAQPQRRLGRGPAAPCAAHRDRAVPPRGLARTARRGGGVRPLPGSRARARAAPAWA